MKPIVLSLLFAFDVEPVLTVHNVELVFILTWKIRKPKLCLCNYGKEHSNIYKKSLIIFNQQAKECFWSVHSAISSKGRTMVKQKTVHGHAWKTCTISYNKRFSKPFPRITMLPLLVVSGSFIDSPNFYFFRFSGLWVCLFRQPLNSEGNNVFLLVLEPCISLLQDFFLSVFLRNYTVRNRFVCDASYS